MNQPTNRPVSPLRMTSAQLKFIDKNMPEGIAHLVSGLVTVGDIDGLGAIMDAGYANPASSADIAYGVLPMLDGTTAESAFAREWLGKCDALTKVRLNNGMMFNLAEEKKDDADTIRRLISLGADPCDPQFNSGTPFSYPINNDLKARPKTLKVMLEHAARSNPAKIPMSTQDMDVMIHIMDAYEFYDPTQIALLKSLFDAYGPRSVAIQSALDDHMVDVRHCDGRIDDLTWLDLLAIGRGYMDDDWVKKFWSMGVCTTSGDYSIPKIMAEFSMEHSDEIQILLDVLDRFAKVGIDFNDLSSTYDCGSPLLCAVRKGSIAYIEKMYDLGARLEPATIKNLTRYEICEHPDALALVKSMAAREAIGTVAASSQDRGATP